MTRPRLQLFHFTCPHGLAAIRADGWRLRPGAPWPAVALGVPTGLASARPVLWLTSDPEPTREAVGLTSEMLTCDRMAYRLALPEDTRAWPWLSWATARGANPLYVAMLGATEAEGREPWRWFVSEQPVQLDAQAAEAATEQEAAP